MNQVQKVFDLLTAYGPLTAAVGQRIFTDFAAAPASPYVVISLVSNVPIAHLEGESESEARIQVNCFALTRPAAAAVDSAVRAALAGIAARLFSFSEYEHETRLFRASTDFHVFEGM